MSLPEIKLPAGMPVFESQGHGAQPKSKFADVAMRTGHGRKRRISTAAPRTVTVSLFLTTNKQTTFEAWFENTLKAGELHFSAQVAFQGNKNLYWWEAEWLDMPTYTPLAPGYVRVTGTLLLTGDASLDGPVSTSAGVEFGAALLAEVDITVRQYASVSFGAALVRVTPAAVEFGAELTQTTISAERRITTSGEYRITRDGQLRTLR